jgi:2-dehydropantoate 2-reductase
MRYVVYGAGAVGGTIAARLFESGCDVSVVARGEHGRLIAERGLTFATPEGTRTLGIPAFDAPARCSFDERTVVLLTMKGQDTDAALRDLAAAAPPGTPVVCAQNGVENERRALRLFERVHGMCIMMPTTFLEAGTVIAHASPVTGILDVGRYPYGVDDVDESLAADLRASTFASDAVPRIMDRKYAKLLANLRNAILALAGVEASRSALYDRAVDEARACFRAAGIVADESDKRSLAAFPVNGVDRGGGSSWQSLARGAGSIETDYLNGEIVLLGRLHGIATPVNAMLQRLANHASCSGAPPASRSLEELERESVLPADRFGNDRVG